MTSQISGLFRTRRGGGAAGRQRTSLLGHQNVVGWIGMSATLLGVAIQSLLPDFTRYSFPIFLAAALLWFLNGVFTRNRPLMCTQAVLILLNAIAVDRWFNP